MLPHSCCFCYLHIRLSSIVTFKHSEHGAPTSSCIITSKYGMAGAVLEQRTLRWQSKDPHEDTSCHSSCNGMWWTAGSAYAAQTAIWLRLAILFPLLPVVYADPEPAPAKNLRVHLGRAVVSLAAFPLVRNGCCSSAGQLHAPAAGGSGAWGARELQGLFERLAALLQALGSARWPAWLQGNQVGCCMPSTRPAQHTSHAACPVACSQAAF